MNIHIYIKSITYQLYVVTQFKREQGKGGGTVILGQKTTCFDVKLLLADLLFEPELQVGPVTATINHQ